MGKTQIGWTDFSFNAWLGCTEAGPGCRLCYARELDKRYQYGVLSANRTDAAPHWGPGRPRYRTSPNNWREPIKWNRAAEAAGKPAKVFCNSLSDVFDNEVADDWRADLFALWRATPWLRWQVVTKRVPNIRKMLPANFGPDNYPNVGLVATVVDQHEWDRDSGRLLSIPAAWHGFSIEPQLENIQLVGLHAHLRTPGRHVWIITGGESRQAGVLDAAGAPVLPRPYDPAWARSILREAHIAPGTYVFVKQTGANPLGLPVPRDGMGKDPAAWPDWMRVQTFVPELLH